MSDPLVSVVIPTFRREAMLVEAVGSVLGQAGVSVEVVVVDDSPEGSAERAIAAMADPRVSYTRRAVPSGGTPAYARNDGLRLARGRYVHFLDDDDLLADGALAALTGALEASPSTGVAFGAIAPFGSALEAVEHEREYFRHGAERLRGIRTRVRLVTEMLFGKTPLVCSAFMIRRECATALGGFSPTVRIVEDVDFYLRAIRRFGFVRVDAPVLHYRVGHASLMHSLTDIAVLRDSYREIYAQYRQAHGPVELAGLRVYNRALRLTSSLRPRPA